MTFEDIIRAAIRTFILNTLAAEVVNDIVTNGLTAADEAIVQSFLDSTPPPGP